MSNSVPSEPDGVLDLVEDRLSKISTVLETIFYNEGKGEENAILHYGQHQFTLCTNCMHDSYMKSIAVFDRIILTLCQLQPNTHLVVICDIDDTIISSEDEKPIRPVVSLIEWIKDNAQEHWSLYFLTLRSVQLETHTKRRLLDIGLSPKILDQSSFSFYNTPEQKDIGCYTRSKVCTKKAIIDAEQEKHPTLLVLSIGDTPWDIVDVHDPDDLSITTISVYIDNHAPAPK